MGNLRDNYTPKGFFLPKRKERGGGGGGGGESERGVSTIKKLKQRGKTTKWLVNGLPF